MNIKNVFGLCFGLGLLLVACGELASSDSTTTGRDRSTMQVSQSPGSLQNSTMETETADLGMIQRTADSREAGS